MGPARPRSRTASRPRRASPTSTARARASPRSPPRAAGRDALALKERPWRSRPRPTSRSWREARALAARLLGAREDAVALVTGAGQVVNAVARGLDLGEGDEVLLPRHEFPSNDLPWRWLARRGVVVRAVEPDDPSGAVSAARLAAEIGPRTRVVAFAHVSYLHGGRIDPAPVVEAARRVGRAHGGGREPGRGRAPVRLRRVRRRRVRGERLQVPARPLRLRRRPLLGAALERVAVADVNWWAVKGAEDFHHFPASSR